MWNTVMIVNDVKSVMDPGLSVNEFKCDKCGKVIKTNSKTLAGSVYELITVGWRPVDRTEFSRMNRLVSVKRGVRCKRCCVESMEGVPWASALRMGAELEMQRRLL
jgi:hypothetical protein